MNTKMKGYRVTDAERKHKVGIAASSFKELESKTRSKFENINGEEWRLPKKICFFLPDGTEVDSEDYFNTLPPQTTLIWVEKGKNADTDADRLYKTIREVNIEYLTAGAKVEDFIMKELKNKINKLSQALNLLDKGKAALSSRREHPDWFEGLDTRSQTKEEYLFRRCQDRIRTYYYKTKDDLNKQNRQVADMLQYLQAELKKVRYFGCYFDRSCFTVGDTATSCLCDPSGNFTCQGLWDQKVCLFVPKHDINPYASREARILFQTWNLDHRVERSRCIVPAITKMDTASIDFAKVFRNLFTVANLKLVHIVCHDKRKHVTATEDYANDIHEDLPNGGLIVK